ncbi:MAG: DUF1835 domain-containing protein [Gemmatimonadales bacterium]|nr:DUF1835 domain-containing protein [Gemmatimonadales bacterium]
MSLTVHIRCGDDLRLAFGRSGLPGAYQKWADPLCIGPVGPVIARPAWRRLRAHWLGAKWAMSEQEIDAVLETEDAALHAAADGADEIVLWCEHDLYDQAILAYLLAWWLEQPQARARLSLIQLDRHPAVPAFHGLGQLDPEHLPPLFAARVPVDAATLREGRRAWEALADGGPPRLAAEAAHGFPRLPFMADALRRRAEEFPGAHGLSRTARQALAAVAAGHVTPRAAFADSQEQEHARWLGDTMFYGVLWDLLDGPDPFLVADEPWRRGQAPDGVTLALTARGRVAAG